MRQGDILTLETLDVAHHLGLRMILVEDFVREEGRGTYELAINVDRVFADFIIEVALLAKGRSEDVAEDAEIFGQCRFVNAQQSDRTAGSIEEVHTTLLCDLTELSSEASFLGEDDAECIEEVLMQEAIAEILKLLGEEARVRVDTACNILQTFGTMVDGIEATHRGQQSLSGTDITRSTLALDMLLASLQCEAIGLLAQAVLTQTDDTTWERTLVLHAASDISSRGTTEVHGYTEALS